MATIAVPGLSPAEVNDMKAAFTIFDRNLKGGITKQTLTAFYAQFGLALSPEDVDAMLSEFTGDPNKKIIDFQTFAKKMHEKKNMWASAFGDAFDMIDDKKTGKITAPRLKQVMGILGEKLTDEEAEERRKIEAHTRNFWTKQLKTANQQLRNAGEECCDDAEVEKIAQGTQIRTIYPMTHTAYKLHTEHAEMHPEKAKKIFETSSCYWLLGTLEALNRDGYVRELERIVTTTLPQLRDKLQSSHKVRAISAAL